MENTDNTFLDKVKDLIHLEKYIIYNLFLNNYINN